MYVKKIKMIISIDNLIDEIGISTSDIEDDFITNLLDAREKLSAEIKEYRRGGETREIRLIRRKQLITTCRILHKSYYELIH